VYAGTKRAGLGYGGAGGNTLEHDTPGDEGGASRFYPCFHYDAKASTRERQAGCEALLWLRDDSAPIGWRRVSREEYDTAPALVAPKSGRGEPKPNKAEGNVHATIKPIGAGDEDGLMRWLVRLITPSGGRVGDITGGSGSTGVACQIEGHDFIGCDIDPGAVDIARARLAFWTPERHRQVLADDAALKAHERCVEREKNLREGTKLVEV
jgi:site-specific DNA-methyltransferase (adenine-specific)